MLELPEVLTLSKQASQLLSGKIITQIFNATKPHKFTFYNIDPQKIGPLLTGKTFESSRESGLCFLFGKKGDRGSPSLKISCLRS